MPKRPLVGVRVTSRKGTSKSGRDPCWYTFLLAGKVDLPCSRMVSSVIWAMNYLREDTGTKNGPPTHLCWRPDKEQTKSKAPFPYAGITQIRFTGSPRYIGASQPGQTELPYVPRPSLVVKDAPL